MELAPLPRKKTLLAVETLTTECTENTYLEENGLHHKDL